MNGTLENQDTWTWTITATQLALTEAKIAKINARADKRGLGGRLSLDVTPVTKTETNNSGIDTEVIEYSVAITGDAPSLNGWSFIATLDWDEHAGLIVRSIPGAPVVFSGHLRENYCAHCGTTRTRKATYVVRNAETGAQLQVGSSCIKDFLGWSGSISFPSDEIAEQGEGWFGPRGQQEFTPATVLAYAWAVIKLHGWAPASGYGVTTRDLVSRALYPSNDRRTGDIDFARTLAPLAEQASAKAAEIAAFITSDDFSGDSEYVTNLKSIVAGELVSTRNFGLLVSAPQAYAKHQEKTLVRERAAILPSEHVAAVGAKITFTATVTAIRFIEGDYGTTVLYSLLDEAGNVYKWFASRDALGEDTGVQVTVKATVKAHDEYNGIKQTVITRAKQI